VLLKRYRLDFPQFFHLVDHQGDYGKIKTSGRGIEMEGELSSPFEMKVQLKFVQVNLNGGSRTIDHF
jgi:hypothetical protein